jgi:hypothetical protein
MKARFLHLIGLGALIAVAGCGEEAKISCADEPKIASLCKDLDTLHGAVTKKFPKGSITKYSPVTQELVTAGSMPAGLLKGGNVQHMWGGPLQVQVFPAHAWGRDTPAMINYVFFSVPRDDCERLVQVLAKQPVGVFQINLEPSKNVHRKFPISGASGCNDGLNAIGYTVSAR